jgi:F-type H+-transporting ATPase subunit beta
LSIGYIVAVSGPVVDVEFREGQLPKIKEALEVTVEGKRCIMEVA